MTDAPAQDRRPAAGADPAPRVPGGQVLAQAGCPEVTGDGHPLSVMMEAIGASLCVHHYGAWSQGAVTAARRWSRTC